MWFWMGIAGGVIGLLVLTPFVVGAFLPVQYQIRAKMTSSRSPAEVFAAIEDFQKSPLAGTMCRGVEVLPEEGGLPAWREDLGSSKVRVATIERVDGTRLRRKATDEIVPMTMLCSYDVAATPSGSELRLSVDGEIRSGTWHVPVFRFVIHVLGMGKAGQKHYLEQLAKRLGGESHIQVE
ncbi:MAG: hypothetical protein ACKVS9_01020 [Phycisphaerae bacterium]